jgi:RimJ/RimL family protein N-acetyltransferase
MPLPLETERLLIRRFEREDVEDRFEYLSDSEVARYEYWEPYSSLEAVRQENEAERAVEPGEEARWFELAVVLRSESKVIGCVGIKILSRQHRFGEVGWTLNPRYQGRGYATEAANAILRFGFEELDLYWLSAFCHVRNEPSWRLMERIGMRRLAHLERNRFTKGEWWDEFVYSILAPEWRSRHGAPSGEEPRQPVGSGH